jgi:alpha-tubulin suppressor-like RCC1 family protein
MRVACGYDFTACITESGKLYCWGTNKFGNLGVENKGDEGSQQIIPRPELVNSLSSVSVIQVVCGKNHMMCLSSEGVVYSWGSGENGVLGHGNNAGLNKPQMIRELRKEKICFIAAGEFNSAAISVHGSLYIWGQGKFGRLGIGNLDNQNTPQKVVDSGLDKEKVSYVSLGFYHTLCCTCK